MDAAIAARLRRQGYRLTPQRRLLLKSLEGEGGHLSAEELHRRVSVESPQMSLSTVYRTIEMLCDEGIVEVAHLGSGRRAFELAKQDPHHHLVCRRCGQIEHIAARHLDGVESHIDREHGFKVEETTLTSYGRCGRCRSHT